MTSRRDFFKKASAFGVLSTISPVFGEELEQERLITTDLIEKASRKIAHLSPEEAAKDEDFWYWVQKAFVQSPNFINLENGYCSPQPLETMNALFKNIQLMNELPSFYMRRNQNPDREEVKKQLAKLAGVSSEEIMITRNTTEALETIIFGLQTLKEGDEVIMTNQDYGSMLEAFYLRARRYGSKNVIISLPLHPKSNKEIVDCYEKAITPRTKVILVTHMINLTGQILPVREIAEMAHSKGIEIISDSAHAFAHIDFKIPDLQCDYFGTSLHKWLSTPLGAGMMYIKKDKIKNIWGLYGETGFADDDIRKFERIGTHPCWTNLTISNAIRFHHAIGAKRKEARLRYLKNYWAEKLKNNPKILINVPLEAERSCGLGNVAVIGKTPTQLADILYDKYRIFTVGIETEAVNGIRVTPHLYTTLEELDAFVKAMEEIAKT
ncbi:MAG: aminotransferase class V-fold PLP-dependent enzyme [Thermoflexibacter sp.]|jgi:selenocysteine lyase/cysteine desulfurase|nr:aminotransferase class V-fold PLP-dependent enzyme [Thermoflexibacter sp.]